MFRAVIKNERGIALLIVMLVMALLIALVFEFAYATRISLNSAVNFRDSQRAYFMALTGINAFKSNGQKLRDIIPAGEWHPVPLPGDSDVQIMVKWEAEAGKIRVADVKTDPIVQAMISNLLENNRIDRAVYDRMTDQTSEINRLVLVTGLHEYMSDEDLSKIRDCFTISPVTADKIDINAASSQVLRSMGITADGVESILQKRKEKRFTQQDIAQNLINPINDVKIPPVTGNFIKNYLIAPAAGDPQITKVYAYATIGGYTKQVEAILNGSTVSYWKAL